MLLRVIEERLWGEDDFDPMRIRTGPFPVQADRANAGNGRLGWASSERWGVSNQVHDASRKRKLERWTNRRPFTVGLFHRQTRPNMTKTRRPVVCWCCLQLWPDGGSIVRTTCYEDAPYDVVKLSLAWSFVGPYEREVRETRPESPLSFGGVGVNTLKAQRENGTISRITESPGCPSKCTRMICGVEMSFSRCFGLGCPECPRSYGRPDEEWGRPCANGRAVRFWPPRVKRFDGCPSHIMHVIGGTALAPPRAAGFGRNGGLTSSEQLALAARHSRHYARETD